MNGSFDANQFSPEQGLGKHPTGKFPAVVSETSIEENTNKDGGYFSVKFTTQAGQIIKNYNLWTQSTDEGKVKMVEIAQKNLSALCHATGVYKLDWQNEGAAIRGARCQIEVTPQTKNPQYNEVSKVYDANGNEPGKAPAMAPQPQPGQLQGGWSQQQPPVPQTQPGWSPQQPTPNPAPAPNAAAPNTAPAWAPGPSAAPGQAPSWASR